MKKARAHLESLAGSLEEPGLPVTSTLLVGRTAHALLEHAEREGEAMVVVGTHSGGFAERALLGTTADRLLRSAPMPVLVVPVAEL
jgi:nucleotide-binding universal stress UspA family protein